MFLRFFKVLTRHRQAVMKEAMRLHPGVGFPLERYVPEGGVELCGVHIPAGTNVGVSAPVVHTLKGVFGEDADKFRPERWIDASAEQVKAMDRAFLAVSYTTQAWPYNSDR